jgi:hypothetical protein
LQLSHTRGGTRCDACRHKPRAHCCSLQPEPQPSPCPRPPPYYPSKTKYPITHIIPTQGQNCPSAYACLARTRTSTAFCVTRRSVRPSTPPTCLLLGAQQAHAGFKGWDQARQSHSQPCLDFCMIECTAFLRWPVAARGGRWRGRRGRGLPCRQSRPRSRASVGSALTGRRRADGRHPSGRAACEARRRTTWLGQPWQLGATRGPLPLCASSVAALVPSVLVLQQHTLQQRPGQWPGIH